MINETMRDDGKSHVLTASYGGAIPWNSVEKRQRTMAVTKNEVSDKNVFNGLNYRKLTPIECERLQTLPDNYTKVVSNSQRYKIVGNGWTVEVIKHLLKGLKT